MKRCIAVGTILLGITVVLAGCNGGSGSPFAAEEQNQTEEQAQQVNYPNGVVKVFNWGEYIDESLIQQFEDEYGIQVIYDTFTTNEEMYPKIAANPSLYDVICPSDYMIEKMIENNLVQEIDWDQIPNIKNMDETCMRRVEDFDPGNKYTVPYTWGTVGILYNTKMVTTPIDSWSVLWDETYENNIIMQDSVRDAFMVALKLLGYSCNSTNENELHEAMELLKEQKPLVKAYAIDEVRDKMINNAAALGVIYSGEYLYCHEENEDLAYAVPKEGSNLWFDGWVITSEAKNVENAHKWLNFLCTADAAYANFEYITYATPNDAAKEMIDPEYLNDPGVFATEERMDKCEIYKYLGSEMEDTYYELWKQVKAPEVSIFGWKPFGEKEQ